MLLYLVRHAIALPHGAPGVQDTERPLTEEGSEKMRQAAAGLRRLGYVPGLLMSSPLVRARQTAEILREAFGEVELQYVPSLAPSGSRSELYHEIARQAKTRESLMLVGHQPSLGEIAGEIVWGNARHSVELKKGGACAIDLESTEGTPKGSLISLLTPSILRKIAD